MDSSDAKQMVKRILRVNHAEILIWIATRGDSARLGAVLRAEPAR